MLRIAKTENGLVRGAVAGDTFITAFKGIPFAAPPVGKNRWRVPQPAENWEGVRECLEFAPGGMRVPYTGTNFYDKEWHNDPDLPMSEDCLYLNVWTPAKTADEKLPVMVWIFGGGLQEGHPGEMEFDGERIARRGVVLVSINYRTNVYGFLAHPEISAECGGKYCTNFGVFDQKAGIDWVGRNIAAFGGDPDNVTIFGQSAGGRSVLAQLVSPLNEGSCIKRAISQSSTGINFAIGGHGNDYYTLAEAEKYGEKFFKEFLGVGTLEEARALPAEFVRDKGAEFRITRAGQWQFVHDDCFLPGQIADLLSEGKRLPVPLMTGYTTNEFFDVLIAKDMQDFEVKARALFGEYADEFLELCEFNKGDFEHTMSLAKVNGSPFGVRLLSMRAVDSGLPVWLYEFGPEIPGDDAGAFHSSELWFTFESLAKCWRPWRGKHYDLARQMCNYWTNFAKTGNPNGLDDDGTPMPEWIPFTADDSKPIVFEDTVHMETEDLTPCIAGMYRLAADKLWRKK